MHTTAEIEIDTTELVSEVTSEIECQIEEWVSDSLHNVDLSYHIDYDDIRCNIEDEILNQVGDYIDTYEIASELDADYIFERIIEENDINHMIQDSVQTIVESRLHTVYNMIENLEKKINELNRPNILKRMWMKITKRGEE
jgi:hypothetical protein